MKKAIIGLLALVLLAPSFAFAAFDTDLRYGSSGAPVLELQEFLTEQGVYSGPVSGNFYSLTLAGVKALQAKLNVTPMSGFFGPLTRGKANELLSADLKESDEEASSTPVVNVPKSKVTHTTTVTSTAVATGGPTSAPLSITDQLKAVNLKTVVLHISGKVNEGQVMAEGQLSDIIASDSVTVTVSHYSYTFTNNQYVQDPDTDNVVVTYGDRECEGRVKDLDFNICNQFVTFAFPASDPKPSGGFSPKLSEVSVQLTVNGKSNKANFQSGSQGATIIVGRN